MNDKQLDSLLRDVSVLHNRVTTQELYMTKLIHRHTKMVRLSQDVHHMLSSLQEHRAILSVDINKKLDKAIETNQELILGLQEIDEFITKNK